MIRRQILKQKSGTSDIMTACRERTKRSLNLIVSEKTSWRKWCSGVELTDEAC